MPSLSLTHFLSPQKQSHLWLRNGLEEHSEIQENEQLDEQNELEEVPLGRSFCEVCDSMSEPGKDGYCRKSRFQAHGAWICVSMVMLCWYAAYLRVSDIMCGDER